MWKLHCLKNVIKIIFKLNLKSDKEESGSGRNKDLVKMRRVTINVVKTELLEDEITRKHIVQSTGVDGMGKHDRRKQRKH